MSVVPLSSPLSSLDATVDDKYLNDCSSVSSLVFDYKLLNSIIESNQFEQSLELYSLMLNNNSLNNSTNISLNNSINQFIEEYSQICLNELKELIEIFENDTFRSFLCSYHLIISQFNLLKKDNSKDKDEENCIVSLTNCENVIDEEKEKEKENSFYASKLSEYNVNRLKIVRLEKREGEALGATITRLSDDDYRISIARILHGSIAQGLFSIGDQLLEINNLQIQSEYRTLDQIVQFIDSLKGTISFLILPNEDQYYNGINNQAFSNNQDDSLSIYVRSLFSYSPYDDMYIPCRELALSFDKGDVFEIVNRDDPSWWQVFIMEKNEKKKKEEKPRIIPSKQFQEKRFKIVKSLLDEQTNNSKKKSKDKLSKSLEQQKRRQKIITTFSFGIYESVEWYIPNELSKRPIVLIGAPHIGRHEFRQRLMNSSELSLLIDVAVPHTTRLKKVDEIGGRDYHFISREEFECEICNDLFVEHGEYENNLYGTSKSAIKTCCHLLNKICILNLLPEGLNSFKYSNIFPYIIYLKAPSNINKLREYLNVSDQQWNEIKEKTDFIEENYSHLFDQIICLNDSFEQVFSQLKFTIKDIQNKSMWINQCWFSPRERF